MSDNEPVNRNGITEASSKTCLICGEHVETTKSIGPVTYVLQPCGHQIDERVYREFVEEQSE